MLFLQLVAIKKAKKVNACSVFRTKDIASLALAMTIKHVILFSEKILIY